MALWLSHDLSLIELKGYRCLRVNTIVPLVNSYLVSNTTLTHHTDTKLSLVIVGVSEEPICSIVQVKGATFAKRVGGNLSLLEWRALRTLG